MIELRDSMPMTESTPPFPWPPRLSAIIAVLGLIVWPGSRMQANAANGMTSEKTLPLSTTVILYDGSLGGLPNTQGMLYQTSSLEVTESFANGATTLDTTAQRSDRAGYFPVLAPTLDRTVGYLVNFTAQVITETHVSNDRAGFSLIVLSSDKQGIELGFWTDEIWAQEDGTAEPPSGTLFTHAEGAVFDTATGLITYTLTVLGDTYTLSAASLPILSGPLRDYTPFTGPIDPYEIPNFIFLGDDTSSARAAIRLSFVSVATMNRVYLPLIQR